MALPSPSQVRATSAPLAETIPSAGSGSQDGVILRLAQRAEWLRGSLARCHEKLDTALGASPWTSAEAGPEVGPNGAIYELEAHLRELNSLADRLEERLSAL